MTRQGVVTITANTFAFLVGQAWSGIRRNGLLSLASVSNIAVSLAILGGMFLAALNLESMARREADKAVITIELKDDAVDEDVELAIWQDPRVEEVDYYTKEANLRAIFERYVENPKALKMLENNPLPDSYRVHPRDPDDIDALAAALAKLDGVARVRYGKQVVEKILVVARSIQISGAILLVLMAFGMILIVNATIRLTVYARRREIRIMQLVGATNRFIQIPFVCEGLFHGLMGGVVAAGVLLLGYLKVLGYVDQHLDFLNLVYSGRFLTLFGFGTVLLGVIVGGTGSAMSLRKYLRLA